MIHTEHEARGRWCPLTFAVDEIRTAEGAGIRQGGPWLCSASNCMAWRWATWQTADGAFHTQRVKIVEGGQVLEEAKPVGGFCGLAGAPGGRSDGA